MEQAMHLKILSVEETGVELIDFSCWFQAQTRQHPSALLAADPAICLRNNADPSPKSDKFYPVR